MTFLELAQMLRQECGVSGSGPASVTNQVGIEKRLVDFVNRAYMDIQRMHRDWSFMAGEFDFTCIEGVSEYTATSIPIADGVSWWGVNSMTVRTTDADEAILSPITWEEYRDQRIGAAVTGRPGYVTVSPVNAIVLWPTPDREYQIRGEYYRRPAKLVNNSDTPAMPEQYHESIVYLAMQFFGRQESAMEVMADGAARYRAVISRMQNDLLPFEVRLGGPLV